MGGHSILNITYIFTHNHTYNIHKTYQPYTQMHSLSPRNIIQIKIKRIKLFCMSIIEYYTGFSSQRSKNNVAEYGDEQVMLNGWRTTFLLILLLKMLSTFERILNDVPNIFSSPVNSPTLCLVFTQDPLNMPIVEDRMRAYTNIFLSSSYYFTLNSGKYSLFVPIEMKFATCSMFDLIFPKIVNIEYTSILVPHVSALHQLHFTFQIQPELLRKFLKLRNLYEENEDR